MKIIICSGYFNPLHVGHLRYLEEAKRRGDALWVIVNNDVQVALKGSAPFMTAQDRLRIVDSLAVVDRAFMSIDEDRTVCETLRYLRRFMYSTPKAVFANGGDATAENVPEVAVCEELGIETAFGIVPQIRESSKILDKAGVR